MSTVLSRVAAIFVCAALAACAATHALEPQHTQLSPRNARIFILRPGAMPGAAQSIIVKINGTEVGSVANRSYLSVDRPPGRYKISASFPLLALGNEHETEVQAGQSYYFVFNVAGTAVAARGGFFMAVPGSNVGKQVSNTNFLTGSSLAVLNASDGAAVLSRLKPP